ncbi:uncharacterized protein LOC128745987 [Sabethes cyaneus]|uniref:uncharacterized protein LOC128745987 n=1 Tax=Sabethes cyaneus TaxID=53552 RepID=UPI00237E8515|nr:uncharacterized protein LOC128745987 [Sabethes cyaneus]
MAMRPISSNVCTPTEKIAAWLVDEMRKYPIRHGSSVKNSRELVAQIQDTVVRRGEILVSFDVSALFPSVPVPAAIKSLREHLERNRAPPIHIEAYITVVKECMSQNFFTFREKIFKQEFGLSMGSKLSPLLAEAFMSDFEVELKNEKLFPRVWKRYVDDVFAIVKERHLPQTLDLLNSRYPTIKFTVEKEADGKLPFLDLLITKKQDNTLKFGIYRKPTSTDRYITSDSNHFGAQKQAAFHSMAHRLVHIPMEEEDFIAEKENIYKAAKINGYDKQFVDRIIRVHERKKHKQNVTTLQPERENIERISIPFYPKITNPIKNILKRHGYHAVYKSNTTIRDSLCNAKDKVPTKDRSGIYQINCKDCPSIYIGQTRRKIQARIKEHRNATENKRINDSSVAMHAISLQHQIDWDSAKMLKNVRKSSHLNAWESMQISTAEQPLMNEDDAPIISPLFSLTKLRM